MLEAVALNASAGTRTLTLPLSTNFSRGTDGPTYAKVKLVINYTYSAATTVVVTYTSSIDGGTTYGSETSTAIAAGAGTVSVYTDTYTTGSANAIIKLSYDVAGCTHAKFVFSGASAGAGDLINVQAVAIEE